jgi:3-oxoacyl-[acyl-carrier protein] reductase
VTGGASGLGRAIVTRYAREGANVLIADMDIDGAQKVADDLSNSPGKIVAHQTDVASEASVGEMVQVALAAFGTVDILVNNAGIGTLRAFLDLPVAEWDLVLAVNLKGPFLCSQAVGRHMAERKSGTIINVSSIESDFGSYNRAHYVASKAGLKNLTRSMALSLAPYNIRVNAIAPGGIRTEIYEKTMPDPKLLADFIEKFVQRIPMKRLGDPSEIGGAAVFLATDDASYITGSTIDVNGGAGAPVPSDP